MEKILAFNQTLAILTIIAQVGVLKILLVYLFRRKLSHLKLYKWFIEKNIWMWAAFILSLLAVVGTLIYSEAIGFPPCRLCWFQRVFMYPILIILGYGLIRKDTLAAEYIKPLALAGAITALYHYIIQMSEGASSACGELGVECSRRLVFEFGYVTIPLMSLTIFLIIFLLTLFQSKQFKR